MKNLVLAIALFSSVFAFSQQKEDWNLRGERKRTVQGIQSGEINRKEAAVIHKQAKDVKQAKKRAVADGVITPKERAIIAVQDKQLDRTIRRTKHNRR
jgi:hypothetical protein